MDDMELQGIIDRLGLINKLYDRIRVVDLINKRVIHDGSSNWRKECEKCHNFWCKNTVCENCVSMRAYKDNDIFIKLEYAKDEIYMLTAIPVQLENRTVIVELLKNATKNLILQSAGGERLRSVDGMINKINQVASRDSLTGLYNRRFIQERLPADLRNAAEAGHRIGLIMADIDHFKNVNDTYGHLAGDEVLRVFGKVLNDELKRETDWVARYGGEEFLICIPGASKDITMYLIERMRKEFENTVIEYGDKTITCTASFGVCHLIPTVEDKMEDLIACADEKLYLAKNNGRNRVEG